VKFPPRPINTNKYNSVSISKISIDVSKGEGISLVSSQNEKIFDIIKQSKNQKIKTLKGGKNKRKVLKNVVYIFLTLIY